MRCVTRRESPDGSLRVSINHSLVVLSIMTSEAVASRVMSHEEWAEFLTRAITNGPIGVLNHVRLNLYPDDGK